MDMKEFVKNNPHISRVNPLNYTKEQALKIQQQFFKTHQFIFKILTSKEEEVLRLRYGIDSGECLTLRETGKKLNISHESVATAEKRAFERLRKFESVKLMRQYDDETFDEDIFADMTEHFPHLVKRGFVQQLEDDIFGLKFGKTSREKARFFKTHMFIFDVLSEEEVKVIKLKCGFETGKFLTVEQIAEKLDLSNSKIRKIERIAYSKLEQPHYLKLLEQYNDDNIDKTIIASDIIATCQNAIYEDVLNAINHDKLEVVDNLKLNNLNIAFGPYGRQTPILINKLRENGIADLEKLINYLWKYNSLKEFGVTKEGLNAILNAICIAIDSNKLKITSTEILQSYNKHIRIKCKKIKQLDNIKQSKVQEHFNNVHTKATNNNEDSNLVDKNIKLDEMGFSLRVYNAVRRAGLDTLDKLLL